MKLYRPSIPVEVKCRVALRQLGEMWPDRVIEENRGKLGRLLAHNLVMLGCLLHCEVKDFRLDHDPPLGERMKRTVYKKTLYSPDANDPNHLRYRPHGTEHVGSHDVKTRIRGDNGQYSDIVRIKRQRRRERASVSNLKVRPVKGKLKIGMKITGAPFGKRGGKVVAVIKGKRKWPKGRKLQGRSSWR